MSEREIGKVTQLLTRAKGGEKLAADQVIELLQDELKLIANRHASHQAPDGTLGGTALVNEVILRMFPRFKIDHELNSEESESASDDAKVKAWNNSSHFVNAASQAMGCILIDHAKSKNTQKRGGGWRQIPLDLGISKQSMNIVDVLALEEAMTELERLNPRHATVVEQRVFGKFTMAEIASLNGVSKRTAEDDWASACLWLRSRLRDLDGIVF